MKRIIAAFAALLLISPTLAIEESDLLPVDEAFAVSAKALDADTIEVRWDIAEGYYMYRGRISFVSQTEGIEIGQALLPKGEEKEDEFFGRVETYRQSVVATIPIRRNSPGTRQLQLQARSQGCADLGVCYPPHRQALTIQLPAATTALATASNNAIGGLSLGQSSGGLLQADALPHQQAFQFEAIALSATEILARWTIAPGYYLYRDKIRFALDPTAPASLGQPRLPPGVDMTDEHFGAVKVYYDQVEVAVPIQRRSREAQALALTGYYQGCKEAGICYPPIDQLISVALPAFSGVLATAETSGESTGQSATTADHAQGPVSETQRLQNILSDRHFLIALLIFFVIGLGLAFTPCVFPMVPILASIIVRKSDGQSVDNAFGLSVAYVGAMVLVYAAIGILIALAGYNAQAAFQNQWIILAVVTVFLALALSMFGFYDIQLPQRWQNKLNQASHKAQGGTYWGAALMGALSVLIVGPCVGPPLAAAVVYLAESGDVLFGGLTLAVLGLGMGTPLLVIGASGGKLLPKAGAWMDTVKAVFGVGLLALAIWMLERIAPPTIVLLLWGVLAIASGVYMGALQRPAIASGWGKLWQSLGLVLIILGILQLVGAMAGGRDWMRPLAALQTSGSAATVDAQVKFNKIKSLQELQAALVATDQPAMLDFYADWCVDCKRMDKYTFPEPPVQAALAQGVAFKADVTANDAIDNELMRAFRIIGPPAILFFDHRGQEMPAYRVVGYQKTQAFAAHVEAAFEAGSR